MKLFVFNTMCFEIIDKGDGKFIETFNNAC